MESELAIGHVVSTKPTPTSATNQESEMDLTRYDGVDIVKHPESARRKKAVFILPAGLSANGVGGKLGTIANMNTGFPVLYIDFPIGRMKLQGRLVSTSVLNEIVSRRLLRSVAGSAGKSYPSASSPPLWVLTVKLSVAIMPSRPDPASLNKADRRLGSSWAMARAAN